MDSKEKKSCIKLFLSRLLNPSTDAVFLVYRYVKCKTKLSRFLYKRKLIKKYNIYIFNDVVIGEGLKLPHPTGIVIGKGTQIGNNVTIYQQVTIGGKNIGDTKAGRIAKIEDDVVIFSGAKILGDVEIAQGTIIGANAVLLESTQKKGVYVGVPAKLKKIINDTE